MRVYKQTAKSAINYSSRLATEKQPILFFDGVCGLCNRTVDFVLQEDRDRRFLFAPLQGETFKGKAGFLPATNPGGRAAVSTISRREIRDEQ